VIEKLVVYPDAMRRNLDRLGGLVHSQQILLALTQAGMSREKAYALVQRHALETWKKGGSFQKRLQADREVAKRLGPARLSALFDLRRHLRHVDAIFARVLGPKAKHGRRRA
jgi:adenylosuccinate lyase